METFYEFIKKNIILSLIWEKDNFEFRYNQRNDGWYCVISHTNKDIRYNSLWEGLTFNTEEEVHEFCEGWNYKDHPCLGKDVEK